jgi:hypothetical protein
MTENSPLLGAPAASRHPPNYIYKPRWVSPTFQSCQNLAIASTMLSSDKCRLKVLNNLADIKSAGVLHFASELRLGLTTSIGAATCF